MTAPSAAAGSQAAVAISAPQRMQKWLPMACNWLQLAQYACASVVCPHLVQKRVPGSFGNAQLAQGIFDMGIHYATRVFSA
jgi:hypothetical protein